MNTDSNGKLCYPEGFKEGCLGTITACLNAENWEICKFTECTLPSGQCAIEVYQTLNTFPRINGQLIGYGGGTPGQTGTYGACVGEIHSGFLNTPNGATNLNFCPGDEAIFSMNGFSIPDSSGLCLNVRIFNENNSLVANGNYGSNSVSGNSVNLTNLFTGLTPGVLYRITFIMVCCNGDPTCNVNVSKSAYIRIIGPFSFSEYGIGGFEPNTHNFYPSTSAPGTILQGGKVISGTNIKVNQFTLIGYNVQNTSNTTVNWTLKERDCITGEIVGGTLESGSISPQTGQPFNIGPILVVTTDDCQCFVLELNYLDVCTGGMTSKLYYFREGTNCSDPGINEDDNEGAYRNKTLNQSSDLIKLLVNPINNHLIWVIDPSLHQIPMSLLIFDTSGREIKSMKNVNAEILKSIDFNEINGMYLYQIRAGEDVFNGKFIHLKH